MPRFTCPVMLAPKEVVFEPAHVPGCIKVTLDPALCHTVMLPESFFSEELRSRVVYEQPQIHLVLKTPKLVKRKKTKKLLKKGKKK